GRRTSASIFDPRAPGRCSSSRSSCRRSGSPTWGSGSTSGSRRTTCGRSSTWPSAGSRSSPWGATSSRRRDPLMPRSTPVLDDEKRSYGALWLVSSLLLFVGALWAIADDNIFRRPWKKWQAEFNRLEIHRLEDAIADEQKRLDADPEYQAAAKALEDAKKSVTSGEGVRKIAQIQRELTQAQHEDQKKDFDLRFVKSELEELRFKYDDALHNGRPTEALLHEIQERELVRAERQKIYSESQAHIEDQQKPWKTHPRRELYLGKHPPEKFGCTPCHGGQGPAVNSVETAHGNFLDKNGHVENVEFIEQPLFRGEKMTANCIKCHAGVQHLDGADEIAHGEHLFEELGCHGCHLTEG